MNYLPADRSEVVVDTKTVENLRTGDIVTSKVPYTVQVARTSLPSKANGKYVRGWLKPTSRSRWSHSCKPPIGSYIRLYSSVGEKYRETHTYPGTSALLNNQIANYCSYFPYNTPQNTVNRVRAEVLGKLADQKINLGQAILEAKESWGTIAQTLTRVLRAYRALRHGKVKQALKYLAIDRGHKLKSKDFGSRWLELQFGWKPLLSDIYGAYQLAQDGLRRGYLPLRVVRELKHPFSFKREGNVFDPNTYEYDGETSFKVVLWYYIEDESLAWASGLGLLNPLQLAWEKIPFSFVIDWAMPIGTVLSAYTATLGIKFLSGTETKRCTYKCNVTIPYYDSTVTTTGEGIGYARTTLSSFPLAIPYVKSPFSSSHTVSALALLQQLRK